MKTLRTRINFFYLILSAITILVFTSYSVIKIQHILLEKSMENARFIARSIAFSLEHCKKEEIPARISRFLSNVDLYPELEQLSVKCGNKTMFSFPENAASNDDQKLLYSRKIMDMNFYLNLNRFIELKTPFRNDNCDYDLQVRMSLSDISRQMKSVYINYGLISFAILSLVYFITLFLSRIIIEPLKALSLATKNIATGEYQEIRGFDDSTETGELVRTFNSMVRNLRKTMEENKLAMVGKMSAGIAHEIRNPLVTILGLTEVLLEDASCEETRKDLAIVVKEVRRVNMFVEQLLQFSRPRQLQFEKGNLKKIFDEVLILIRHELKSKQIELISEWEELDDPVIDSNCIKQIFLNVLFNAIQFSPEKSVISVKAYSGSLEKNHIKVEISDKGQGISADKMKHVFEPFFTTREGGSGLGLSIVKRLMAAHGGDIYLLSRESVGTTAVLFFPLKNQQNPV